MKKATINIKDIINNMKKWGIETEILTKNNLTVYYYCGGNFYREDNYDNDGIIEEAQVIKELTNYIKVAEPLSINNNGYVFWIDI